MLKVGPKFFQPGLIQFDATATIKYKEANVNTQDENQNNKNEVEDLMLGRHPLPKPNSDGSAEMKYKT